MRHGAFTDKKGGKHIIRKHLTRKQRMIRREALVKYYDAVERANPQYQKELAECVHDAIKNWKKGPALSRKEFRELLDRLSEGARRS